jgi:hypothetical protein
MTRGGGLPPGWDLRGEPIVVLGLPRGGVPVAFQMAWALGAPLDVIIVRKLGVPFQSELGMGAAGEDGVRSSTPRSWGSAGYRKPNWRPSRHESRPRCKPAPCVTGPCGRASRWPGGWPWWSMTDRHRVHGPGRLPDRPGPRDGPGRDRRARHATRMAGTDRPRRRRACLRRHAVRVLPSASGMPGSPRSPMTRSSRAWSALRRPGPGASRHRARRRCCRPAAPQRGSRAHGRRRPAGRLPDRAGGRPGHVVFVHGSGSSMHSPPQPVRRRRPE